MKPNPLSALDIPADWPEEATTPNGETIMLRDAWATLSYAQLASLTVNVPGRGRIAPYGDAVGFDDFELDEDTEGLLTREDLEASGRTDEALEMWAKNEHGITIVLSGEDTPDLQALRGNAYRRFLESKG